MTYVHPTLQHMPDVVGHVFIILREEKSIKGSGQNSSINVNICFKNSKIFIREPRPIAN